CGQPTDGKPLHAGHKITSADLAVNKKVVQLYCLARQFGFRWLHNHASGQRISRPNSQVFRRDSIDAMSNTRRTFLKTAGLAAAPVPAAQAAETRKKAYRQSRFSPSSQPRRISDHLYAFDDTCTVYVIRDGSRAVLIDFGSGKILDHLSALGIS